MLPTLGLSVADAAEQLGVTRAALSRGLNGHAAISPEVALRLKRWLGQPHGGRAAVCLGIHSAHDLWSAENSVW